jgi:hypothetical protein
MLRLSHCQAKCSHDQSREHVFIAWFNTLPRVVCQVGNPLWQPYTIKVTPSPHSSLEPFWRMRCTMSQTLRSGAGMVAGKLMGHREWPAGGGEGGHVRRCKQGRLLSGPAAYPSNLKQSHASQRLWEAQAGWFPRSGLRNAENNLTIIAGIRATFPIANI